MKAFILAGGLGTRLRSRFGDLPKSLVPVGGKPFLRRQLEWLAAAGIREVVLCLGHGADAVREALGDGAALGMTLHPSVEEEPLGTGGALQLAARHVTGPCLVVNGDTLPACDPWALERTRWEVSRVGAVAVFRVEDASGSGRVELEPDGRVARFVEKDAAHAGPAWVNGGLYAFAPELWCRMPSPPGGRPATPFSLERDLLPALASGGRLVALASDGGFLDIGTPEGWERAERRFSS
jgi:NDP-sugar pyrophosphorylase family protein